MKQLILEYVLEGHQRGYNFTSSTQGFHDDVLKAIWRRAMPRGQGWNAAVFAGARSLKSFALDDGRMALSETVVTDMRDESGRGGIRRAVVSVMQPGEYLDVLRERLAHYPELIHRQTAHRSLPSPRGEKQVILSYPYVDAVGWQTVEALVLRAALKQAAGGLLRGGRLVPFTTLALDYREEGQWVALPEEKAAAVRDGQVVRL